MSTLTRITSPRVPFQMIVVVVLVPLLPMIVSGHRACWEARAVAAASILGFIAALLSLAVLVVRTALEDRTLQAELPGYSEYARGTRYRLLPGVS